VLRDLHREGEIGSSHLCRDGGSGDLVLLFRRDPGFRAAAGEWSRRAAGLHRRLEGLEGVCPLLEEAADGTGAVLVSRWPAGEPLGDLAGPRRRVPERGCRALGVSAARILGGIHGQGLCFPDGLGLDSWFLDREGRLWLHPAGLLGEIPFRHPRSGKYDHLSRGAVATEIEVPPEMFGGTMDARSDVWSLGRLLYRLSVGLSFGYGAEGMVRILAGPPLDPRERAPDLSEAFGRTVARMLHPGPDGRFPDMAACAEALEARE